MLILKTTRLSIVTRTLPMGFPPDSQPPKLILSYSMIGKVFHLICGAPVKTPEEIGAHQPINAKELWNKHADSKFKLPYDAIHVFILITCTFSAKELKLSNMRCKSYGRITFQCVLKSCCLKNVLTGNRRLPTLI